MYSGASQCFPAQAPSPSNGYHNGDNFQAGGKAGNNRRGAGKGQAAAPFKKGGKAGTTSGGQGQQNSQHAPTAGDARAANATGKGGSYQASAQDGGGPGFDRSLRSNLEVLCSLDSRCIVQCRKINRLGFESAQVLEEQLSRYGKVSRVLVSHCYAKARNNHYRPSSLGFVVMSEPEEAEAILANGPELPIWHAVGGNVTIHVQSFKSQVGMDEEQSL
jgi:hypothetical protein